MLFFSVFGNESKKLLRARRLRKQRNGGQLGFGQLFEVRAGRPSLCGVFVGFVSCKKYIAGVNELQYFSV